MPIYYAGFEPGNPPTQKQWVLSTASDNRMFPVVKTPYTRDPANNVSFDNESFITGDDLSGAFSTSTRVYIIDNGTKVAEAYDHSFNRITADDISLSQLHNTKGWRCGVATATRLFFVYGFGSQGYTAYAYNHSGVRQSSDDISLIAGSFLGAAFTATRLYFIDRAGSFPNYTGFARAYDHSGNRQSADDITLGAGYWFGGVSTPTRLFIIDSDSNSYPAPGRAVAYDHSGNRQATDDITLYTLAWRGGFTTSSRLYFLENNYKLAHAYTLNASQTFSRRAQLQAGDRVMAWNTDLPGTNKGVWHTTPTAAPTTRTWSNVFSRFNSGGSNAAYYNSNLLIGLTPLTGPAITTDILNSLETDATLTRTGGSDPGTGTITGPLFASNPINYVGGMAIPIRISTPNSMNQAFGISTNSSSVTWTLTLPN